MLSSVCIFAIPWTVAYEISLTMEFSRQEYWSGLPFPSPGDPPSPGNEPRSPSLQADSLPSEPHSKMIKVNKTKQNKILGLPDVSSNSFANFSFQGHILGTASPNLPSWSLKARSEDCSKDTSQLVFGEDKKFIDLYWPVSLINPSHPLFTLRLE